MNADRAITARDGDLPIYRVGTLTYTRRQLGMLFFWLLWGDVCYMLMESVTPSVLPLELQHLGASNTSIGLVLTTIPMLMTAVLNPVISFRSDRFRSRWGRRIPFLLFTLPFLLICLVGLGYADRVGLWLGTQFGAVFGAVSPQTLALSCIGVFMVAFTFFNSFVNSVFWYLFNDVVPEHLLARFMSLFRLLSMASASVYNLFIFQYAGSHSAAILTGAGILYFVGFGLMCVNVREGEYPPPPALAGNRSAGVAAAVKTFAGECHGLAHYWFQFLSTICTILAASAAVFMLFFYQSTGMSLQQIGQIQGFANIAVGCLIPLSGWLADRYHPIRVVIAGYLFNIAVVLPATMVWLIWHPPAQTAFWIWIVISAGLAAPMTAMVGVGDPPLLMRLFPRSRYGQFCAANGMWRALGGTVGGVLAGAFFDLIKRHAGIHQAYFFVPVWQLVFTVPGLVCILFLYQSWKRYGGDDAYVPPIPGNAVAPVPGALPLTADAASHVAA